MNRAAGGVDCVREGLATQGELGRVKLHVDGLAVKVLTLREQTREQALGLGLGFVEQIDVILPWVAHAGEL